VALTSNYRVCYNVYDKEVYIRCRDIRTTSLLKEVEEMSEGKLTFNSDELTEEEMGKFLDILVKGLEEMESTQRLELTMKVGG
jgi:hypothetical protein